jgi:hypothetical protein
MNDPQVVSYITKEFVAVNGAVEMLQPDRYGGGETAASRWFGERAKKAIQSYSKQFWDEHKTLQGFYVLGADGNILMYKVGLSYRPDDFLNDLKKAKSAFVSMPSPVVPISPQDIAGGAPMQPDESTSVIRVFSRIVPIGQNSTISERSIGRDHMWIFANEVKEIVSSAIEPNVQRQMPRAISARLVRFQLLNHVGNIMQTWDENQVKSANFTVKLMKKAGNVNTYDFEGTYDSRSDAFAEHGAGSLTGTISGVIDIDTTSAKITRFRAYGEAESQGRNDSLARDRKYPVVFAMVEATDRIARNTPPFWYGVSPVFRPSYKEPKLACWQ